MTRRFARRIERNERKKDCFRIIEKQAVMITKKKAITISSYHQQ
jgi:hypothetical protein